MHFCEKTKISDSLDNLSLTDFHRGTEAFQRTGGARREERPLPIPSPEGKGHNHRDTHVANHQHLTPITQHPSEASPPAPLRMERGVITEVTPTSLFVS